MSASKNDTKQARQHSIASANASSHASHTGLAVQPPVVQLSIQEDDENQPQPETQIQKTKEYSANPNGDDPGNTPPANPNQGNGSGKGNLPFQLKTSSETQPIHSFLSGKSNERSTAIMQQSPDAVHQFLNSNHTVLQRKIDPEGGIEVGTSGGKVNLGISTSRKINMSYATATIKPKALAVAELKPTKDHPGSVSGTNDSAKASINIYTGEATEQGSAKFGDMVYKEIDNNGWEIEKVDWESELGKGEDKKGMGSASIATGVKFTFKNGHEAVVKAQLFEKSAGAGLSGPSLIVEPTLKFDNITLWENQDAKLTYNGEFSLEMSLAPNWAKIFQELAKRGGREVARRFAQAALTGSAGALVTGGMIVGGALAVFATVQSIINAGEIKATVKQAELAAYSYVRGWCTGWGINDYGAGGLAEFVSKGSADASVKLNEAVGKIQQNPVFAHWEFTAEELLPLLKEKLSGYGPQVFKQVHAEVKDQIYRDFVVNFYYQNKNWYTPISITRKNAIWVAKGLNLKDAEQLVPKE